MFASFFSPLLSVLLGKVRDARRRKRRRDSMLCRQKGGVPSSWRPGPGAGFVGGVRATSSFVHCLVKRSQPTPDPSDAGSETKIPQRKERQLRRKATTAANPGPGCRLKRKSRYGVRQRARKRTSTDDGPSAFAPRRSIASAMVHRRLCQRIGYGQLNHLVPTRRKNNPF